MNFRNSKTMCCLFRTHTLPRALSLLTAFAAAFWLCLLPPHRAQAAAYTYDTSARRTVNAGILLLDSTTDTTSAASTARGPSNKDPYLFHVLNQRIDIRPFGWNIVNPLAPRTVTQAIQARWFARANNTAVYGVGQTITPNMAPYWEVDLHQTAAQDLSQFDVLFLGIDTDRQAQFSVTDTQKLLRFVDNGGILWIEYVGNGITATQPIDVTKPLFFKLQFAGSNAGSSYGTRGPGGNLPLVTTPYNLSNSELNSLGDKGIGDYYCFDGASASNPPGSGLLSTVLGNSGQGNKPVIAAGSLGAGGIVVSTVGSANAINETVDVSGNISGPDGFNSGPYCGTNFLGAPTQDLKFLSDMLASVGGHLNAHQNSHNTGSTPNGIPSASRTWTTSGNIPGGRSPAVINGNLAYVTTGNTLRAFDLYPAEDLDSDNSPDDGAGYAGGNANVDYSKGAPYDQVWQQDVGDLASAPTVAVDPGSGKALVFVEKLDGTVVAFDGTNGSTYSNSPLANSGGRGSYSIAVPTPAPTFYNGKLYAGGQDGTLYVYNFATGADAKFNQDPTGSSPRPVVAPPTVGTVMDAGINDILALVTTDTGLYSVFLGARGETLAKVPGGYNTRLQPLPNARMDAATGAGQTYKVYTIPSPSNGYPRDEQSSIATANATASPNFTLNAVNDVGTLSLLADYDVDFSASASASPNGPLTRTFAGLSSSGNGTTGNVSAPALDRNGNVYYTTASALFCVHDTAALPQIKWRFRIPPVGMTDADGTDYTPLVGYVFVGAPVVDEQGLVYALASNGSSSVVLCFNGQLGVSADAPGAGTNIQISQLDPSNPTKNEFGDNAPSNINGNQFGITTDGLLEFSNFAPNASGGTKNLYPNLNEPFPIQIQVAAQNNQIPPPPFTVALHTNLVWYSITGNYAPAAISGLTKVGSSLFYTAANGHLIYVNADPATANATPLNKAVTDQPGAPPVLNPMFHDAGDSGVGAGAVPSSANGVLVVNGPNGVSTYTNQVTLVVDNNRIIETDSSGNAMWTVDSTLKTAIAGGVTPVYNGGAPPANPGQYVTTSLELNRPSSVYEMTANDYLVADTGNNRCVRFDRGAKVIWELTKFYQDPANLLLRPGEPDTLNQPTSVQVRSYTSNGITYVQYLVADTGNFRIVEITDEFAVVGNQYQMIKDHILTWVSHTHDVQGRQYRYQGAGYYSVNYTDTDGTARNHFFITALVTNKRIAPVPLSNVITGALAPANQDTNGGTIVLLNYANALPGGPNLPIGYIASATTSFQANGRTIQLRNPRFLRSYSPNPPSTTSYGNFLVADDNGVFDLALTGPQFTMTWGFTQAQYQAITTPIDAAGAAAQAAPSAGLAGLYDRTRIPFFPTSLQKLGANHYLVTNGFAQGEAGTTFGDYGNAVPPGFGGEVFEIDTSGPNPIVGGYGNHTLSRPTNTSPLTQPMFAHRVQ